MSAGPTGCAGGGAGDAAGEQAVRARASNVASESGRTGGIGVERGWLGKEDGPLPRTIAVVFDVARAVALLFAFAGWIRTRDAIGGVVLAALLALFAWDVGAPLAHHSVGGPGPGAGFGFVFLGPSVLAPRPLSLLAEGLLGIVASRMSFARARPLRPESVAARAWDLAGLRFFFVATLALLLLVLELLLARLLRDD